MFKSFHAVFPICFAVLLSASVSAFQSELNRPGKFKVQEIPAIDSVVDAPKKKEIDDGAENKPERVQTRFPTGEIKIERWVIENTAGDFINHGEFVEFDISGNVVCAGHFKNGQRTGIWSKLISEKQVQSLFPDLSSGFKGPYESKAEFENGLLSKDWSCTDANGNLVFVWNFKAGKRDGESIWLDANGQTVQSVQFKNNLAHGSAITLVDSRNPAESRFENGLERKVVTEFYPQKIKNTRFIKSRTTFLVPFGNNLKAHDWVENRITFRPVLETKPIQHGPFAIYYSNGQKACQGTYEHGQKSGDFNWWYANGQKKVTGRYSNNLESGAWSWWHENGIRMARGTYANGIKVNQWSTWNEDGKLLKRLVPSADQPGNSIERIAELPGLNSKIK